MAATIFQMRGQLARKRAFLVVDNEAACAALTKGTAKNNGALVLVFAFQAVAAQRDVGLWAERAPTEANPADVPPRGRDLFFETELARELASFKDALPIYDFS